MVLVGRTGVVATALAHMVRGFICSILCLHTEKKQKGHSSVLCVARGNAPRAILQGG